MPWYNEKNKQYRYPHYSYSAAKAIWKTIWLGMNVRSLSSDWILAVENESWSAGEVFLRLVEQTTA